MNIFIIYSIEFKGIGYGKDEAEAKKNSLSDLAAQIEVEVSSEITSITSELTKGNSSKAEDFTQSIIKTKSELPILGVKFSVSRHNDKNSKYEARSILNSRDSLPLYEEKILNFKNEIENYLISYNSVKKSSDKKSLLEDILTLIIQFNKYKTIAVFLGTSLNVNISVTESEIKLKLLTLENKIETLDSASKKITSEILEKKIYIYPAVTRDSHEITQFASLIKDYMSKYLSIAADPSSANFFMKGKYEILSDGIELYYQLADSDFNVLSSKIVKILPEAYEHIEINPKTLDFDKLLHEGVAVSNDFRIEISTNKGKSDLLFKKNEIVELFVKLNRQSYFYAVGYIFKEKEKYSYLLEMLPNANPEKRRFIRYVGADDLNKWINIGDFEVSSPFGVESLQFIASTADPVDNLPDYIYNSDLGYYLISKNPLKGIAEVRGLKVVGEKKYMTAENVLFFTTRQ